jgi:hypothetical protein
VDREDLEIIRADMKRSDQRFAQMVARWDKREDRRHHEAMAEIRRLDAKADALLEEARTSRQALLAILDRLSNGGTAPAT